MIPLNEEKNDISAFDMSDIEEEYKEAGIRKAAILLMTLGPEASNEVIKDLPDEQIQKIGLEIANIHHISSKERRQVLKELKTLIMQRIDIIMESKLKNSLNLRIKSKSSKILKSNIIETEYLSLQTFLKIKEEYF